MENCPERPKEEDCCGSGCNPCIFDVYEQKLKQFKLNNLIKGPSVFNDMKYTKFLVSDIKQITKNTNLYTFQPIDSHNSPVSQAVSFKMGDYIILKASFTNNNGCEESISRPYTPILNNSLLDGLFQVIIRLYEYGKMSQVIKSYKSGDITHWRGPYNHLKLKKTKHLLLLGAGTGVVPLYNIAKELVDDEKCDTLVTLVGCFSDLNSILLRDELQALKDYWNFYSELYIAEQSNENIRYNEKVIFCKLNEDSFSRKLLEFNVCDLFLVICGPDAFNESFKDVAIKCRIDIDNVQIM